MIAFYLSVAWLLVPAFISAQQAGKTEDLPPVKVNKQTTNPCYMEMTDLIYTCGTNAYGTETGSCLVPGTTETQCYALYGEFGNAPTYYILSISPQYSSGGMFSCGYAVGCKGWQEDDKADEASDAISDGYALLAKAHSSSLKLVQGQVMDDATGNAVNVWGVSLSAMVWLVIGLVLGCFGLKMFALCRQFHGYDDLVYQKIGSVQSEV